MKQQSKTIQKKVFIGILCSVILIFLDQFTKYLAVQPVSYTHLTLPTNSRV